MKKKTKKATKKVVSKKAVASVHKTVKAPKAQLSFPLAVALAVSAVFMLLVAIYKYVVMG